MFQQLFTQCSLIKVLIKTLFLEVCLLNNLFMDMVLAQIIKNWIMLSVRISSFIIQQIVTLSKYGHDALDICHPQVTDIRRYYSTNCNTVQIWS